MATSRAIDTRATSTVRGGCWGGLLLALASLAVAQPAATLDDWQHEVVKGDTLIAIASEYVAPPGSWQRVARLNKVRDPRRLAPGTRLRIPLAWLRQEASVAEVLFVHGRASVQRGGGDPQDATVGSTLSARDALRTADDGSITIRFADGSRLLVSPNTEVSIEQLLRYGRSGIPGIRLRIDHGETESRVVRRPDRPVRFEILTPAVNLGVRGTEFRTAVDARDQATRVEVLQGQVAAFGRRDPLRLDAGFGSVIASGGATSSPQRLMGTPDLATLPALVERVPLRLDWPPLAGAEGYRAQVFAAEADDRLLLDGVFSEPAAKWADLPDGRYVLRVGGIDARTLQGVPAQAGFVLKARPEPPFTREPAADARSYGDTATFRWARSTAAERYRLQVSATPDFAAPLVDRNDLSATELRLALAPGRYAWRVASIAAGDDQGPFGDAQSFSQRPVPASPSLEPPERNDDGLLFRWHAPEPGQKVQFQVASDAAFERIVLDQQTDGAQGLLPRPSPGTYFLRARTIDADGFAGSFGTVQQVEVPHSRWWLLVPASLILLIL
jgi:hypothetical protein